ncbi:MAG: energy-coupling factor ABC transporter permease [Candidatus Omnitrophota bacterium]
MHIPDGFLTPQVFVSFWVVALGGLTYVLNKTKQFLKERAVPLMGVTAAFIFAAQMLNFPIIGGTSGHLLGGVLAAVLLGPYAGAVVLSLVLIVQSLVFQDGGLTALGANIFNMAFIGAMGGYFIYAFLKKTTGLIVSVAIASWFSVVSASFVCAVQLVLSGTSVLKIVLPAMAGIHMLIGIGEAIITCLIISFVHRVRPDLIYQMKPKLTEQSEPR